MRTLFKSPNWVSSNRTIILKKPAKKDCLNIWKALLLTLKYISPKLRISIVISLLALLNPSWHFGWNIVIPKVEFLHFPLLQIWSIRLKYLREYNILLLGYPISLRHSSTHPGHYFSLSSLTGKCSCSEHSLCFLSSDCREVKTNEKHIWM